MDEAELLGMVIHAGRESARWLLERSGAISPFGVILAGAAAEVRTRFPRDEHPGASWEELLGLAESELRRRASAPETRAVAVVAEVHSERDRAVCVQAETRTSATVLMYPFRKNLLGGWWMGDASPAEAPMRGRLFAAPGEGA